MLKSKPLNILDLIKSRKAYQNKIFLFFGKIFEIKFRNTIIYPIGQQMKVLNKNTTFQKVRQFVLRANSGWLITSIFLFTCTYFYIFNKNTHDFFWEQAFLTFDLLFLIVAVFVHVQKINKYLENLYKIQIEKDKTQEHMTIIGELTSGVNHEIKNIICLAGLHSNYLSKQLKRQNTLSTDEILNSVQKIESSVLRAEKIIQSVSKISFDSKNETKKEVSIYEIFEEVKDFATFFAEKNKVDFKIPEVDAHLKIFGHSIQIMQVLINLVKNATEAIEQLNERWVHLTIEYLPEPQHIEIRVMDSGPGIPEAVRKKLFENQFTTKAPGKGTGLGLSISAKIIADHGGSLRVDETAKNTTFVISLPATHPVSQMSGNESGNWNDNKNDSSQKAS